MNNIFSALIHKKTAGVIREFVLWCILCFVTLLFLIAAIIAGSKPTWVLLFLFCVGLAVLTVFRLTEIALVYSAVVFHLFTCIIHYICYGRGGSSAIAVVRLFLFILLLLISLSLVSCSLVHLFSRYNLSKVVMVLTITDSVFVIFLQFIIYVARRSRGGFLGIFFSTNVDFKGYWVGTICFWILLVVIDLYAVFAAFGMIETKRSAASQASRLQLQTQSMCVLRYIPEGPGGGGYYELYDESANGVYLANGMRLMKNSWNRLQRGSEICIENKKNKLRLL